MPSKYGFGNTRKKSPYKMGKAHYGMDQRNPVMKKETLPGIDTEIDAKKSPAKAGQTAGQIVRRERHMV
jgi:hypothetical protein